MSNSVMPLCVNDIMRTMTWRGFNDTEYEDQYIVYKRNHYRQLYNCFSFVGIAYNAVNILTIIIWNNESPPLSLLTALCICLLLCVTVFLSSMITEIMEHFQMLLSIGGIVLTVIEFYAVDALHKDSSTCTLIWSSLISFCLLGQSVFSVKLQILVAILLLTPNLAFIQNFSFYEALNETFGLKILNFIVYLIPVLIVGLSQYLYIDMEIREQFSLQNQLRQEKQALISRLKNQEHIVFSQLSYRIGFQMLSDVGERRSNDRKVYTWKYKNTSILVIQLVHHYAPRKVLDVLDFTVLHEILVQCEALSKTYCHEILKVDHDSMVLICDDTKHNQTTQSVCMALAMMQKVRTVSDNREVDITAKAGIHYGDINSAVVGQYFVQLDVFGTDYRIARTIQELGYPGSVHCSQYVKRRLGINKEVKENVRMSRDGFLSTNSIRVFEVTEEFNKVMCLGENQRNFNAFSEAENKLGCFISSTQLLYNRTMRNFLDRSSFVFGDGNSCRNVGQTGTGLHTGPVHAFAHYGVFSPYEYLLCDKRIVTVTQKSRIVICTEEA